MKTLTFQSHGKHNFYSLMALLLIISDALYSVISKPFYLEKSVHYTE